MTAIAPLTVAEASAVVDATRRGVRSCALAYDAARDSGYTNRARGEWSMAVLEWAEALAAHAAAIDRDIARRHGKDITPAEPLPAPEVSGTSLAAARRRLDDCARRYDRARVALDLPVVAAAHAEWVQALGVWVRVMIASKRDEDQAAYAAAAERATRVSRIFAV